MIDRQLKIVSLIPSATEIVVILGLTDAMVGRSHECDYPPEIQNLPVCTQPKFNPEGSSREIHNRATELLQSALSVYRVETETLEKLEPTHIITQAQCDVCAASLAEVEAVVANLTKSHPQIISLQPNLLAEVWADMEQVAMSLGVDGNEVIFKLKSRVKACSEKTQNLPVNDIPKVACIEWSNPLMAAGNWIPELVKLAGGNSLFGVVGKHSPWLKWEELLIANPDIIIFMPCGFDLERTRQDTMELINRPEWQDLPVVKSGKVYITDGNSYFNRPGPRLVDSLEILAEILHPELFNFGYGGIGWVKLS
ncbi:MAG: cobalamin-binding protein [Okeania sp. SIO2G4]|uniref:cobalamin-binding protein n=1 Tax=unclassified Okeania TaxID=2634635 RepID=UPI0013B8F540|nr:MULTISPECIES: cobalamin-binding protein [unclassified Okeania]NEP05011.1 cobalamin-binding protein [Okeania sp. SIO4D6]NEP38210.1 cobalamin-binding protein [Okeania sp. SIO2H7]NEP75925.1 cobalamin-binding protein [Okeania sp. SIO2G5]NEP97104.1 cobalamin-binding protein [Okeania sp. SIO2F5]NEQ94787.1 cobalamin-binding protein [Okeania sp. SIO2G4]